jgi:hypothetical protein
MATIHYTTRTEDVETGRVTRTNESYTPTIEHAREWANEIDKFVYTLDMLGMSLADDGENAERTVERVEEAYEDLIWTSVQIQRARRAQSEV